MTSAVLVCTFRMLLTCFVVTGRARACPGEGRLPSRIPFARDLPGALVRPRGRVDDEQHPAVQPSREQVTLDTFFV